MFAAWVDVVVTDGFQCMVVLDPGNTKALLQGVEMRLQLEDLRL